MVMPFKKNYFKVSGDNLEVHFGEKLHVERRKCCKKKMLNEEYVSGRKV